MHTPAPWFADGTDIYASPDQRVALTTGPDDGIRLPNAAYIVQCVNAHQPLVDALETTLYALENAPTYNTSDFNQRTILRALDTTRAALRLAKGEEVAVTAD